MYLASRALNAYPNAQTAHITCHVNGCMWLRKEEMCYSIFMLMYLYKERSQSRRVATNCSAWYNLDVFVFLSLPLALCGAVGGCVDFRQPWKRIKKKEDGVIPQSNQVPLGLMTEFLVSSFVLLVFVAVSSPFQAVNRENTQHRYNASFCTTETWLCGIGEKWSAVFFMTLWRDGWSLWTTGKNTMSRLRQTDCHCIYILSRSSRSSWLPIGHRSSQDPHISTFTSEF